VGDLGIKWEDNIQVDLKEIVSKGADCVTSASEQGSVTGF
jgi:hypothetical protein